MTRARNPPAPHQWLLFFVLITAILQEQAEEDARAGTVNVTCATQRMHSTTLSVPSFVSVLADIGSQIQVSSFGWAINGIGLDTIYGLGQCYGDLALQDCVQCYVVARTIITQCVHASGGHVFLDGCFLRHENYNFFKEYSTPEDHAVCEYTTSKDSAFLEPDRQAVLKAVASAPRNDFFAMTRVAVPGDVNQSAYVLANCWKTLDESSCKACLESASVLILECLPSSEGRALKAGCFMRYSDIDFLNILPRKRSREGTIIAIVVLVINSLIVLVVGAVIGVYIWKRRNIERKRRGNYLQL